MSKFMLNTMKEISSHTTRERKISVIYCLILTALFLNVSPLASFAQKDSLDTPKVYIAAYQGDAPGAFTLIQDDFGAAYAGGTEMYSDTIAFKRGIPFCFAAITKECDAYDWKRANEMIKHGHQILNHTHSHLCGTPQSWCTFGDWDENDFATEIDLSTELIQTNTGAHPAFFIFPFELFTDTMITYVRSKGYAGARAGRQGQLQPYTGVDPFHLNCSGHRPGTPVNDMTQFADRAIKDKGWAVWVMHGVADDSWGALTVEEYRTNIDYLKEKKEQGQLWIATYSDVLWYMTLKDKYTVRIGTINSHKAVEKISFDKVTTAQVYNSDEKLNEKTLQSTSHVKTLTVVVAQTEHTISKIIQKEKPLKYEYRDGKLLIEANPDAGEVIIHYTNK
jgi:peptidoglycan/xylan/chitin deacetylase (PgdA/CDA1 family)